MDYKIYGTFKKYGEYTYRANTYIQFGESEDILGACVLCNPGSAKLEDKEKEQKLINSLDDIVVEGEIVEDPAMKQLVKILRKSYDGEIEGRFHILNLFTLKKPVMTAAIAALNKLNDEPLLDEDFLQLKKLGSKVPWLLVAWGCNDNRLLKERKWKWLNYINNDEREFKFTGLEHKTQPHYYYINPLVGDKGKVVDDLVTKIKEILPKEGLSY